MKIFGRKGCLIKFGKFLSFYYILIIFKFSSSKSGFYYVLHKYKQMLINIPFIIINFEINTKFEFDNKVTEMKTVFKILYKTHKQKT